MGERPLGIIVLAAYLAITGAIGLVLSGTQLFTGLMLEYINGFVVFSLIIYLIMIIPALLSVIAGYRVWTRKPRAARLITWAMALRILLATFPPGSSGPLGIGILSVPFDVALLIYAYTRGVTAYFAARPAEADPSA